MTRLFGIAGIQMTPVAWDPNGTIDKMQEIVTQVGRSFPWVNLCLFHELVVPGLVQFTSAPRPDIWPELMQPIPGPFTDRLCEIARRSGRWLAPGSMYETVDGKVYNTALVISPDGEIVAKYRKIFPWLPFEAGTAAGDEFCVFDIPDVGRFGLCICYDTWFPETVRTLAWMGAEVILHPTMTPTADRPLELVMNQANAVFNQCYFVDINGVGPWGGGRSMIVDPDGRIVQQAGERETILTEILDLDNVRKAREFGTLGLCQLWKQLRTTEVEFPIYRNVIGTGEIYRNLGDLKAPKTLNLP
ncbi:MAG: carbon-nitrogen hydrolase family protein [Anaerolineales bacterium]|nr:carbon-nitrogen hydrolase family protein [Anaerolineales bacterium]